MTTEQELDQIYNEVVAERKLIEEKGFYHDEILELVKDSLKQFKLPAKDDALVQYITILFEECPTSCWTIDNDMRYIVIKKLSEIEEEYFEGLVKKYCYIEKIDDTRWELRLK